MNVLPSLMHSIEDVVSRPVRWEQLQLWRGVGQSSVRCMTCKLTLNTWSIKSWQEASPSCDIVHVKLLQLWHVCKCDARSFEQLPTELCTLQMVNTIQWYVLSLTLSTALQVDGEWCFTTTVEAIWSVRYCGNHSIVAVVWQVNTNSVKWNLYF